MNSLLFKGYATGFVVAVNMALGVGCSDSPKQYGHETPAAAKIPVIPDQGKLGNGEKPTPGGVGIDDDQLTRQNAREPIVYGVGAGGVTFETDFKTAQPKLSKPIYGPDGDGLAVYNSGMYIWWRDSEPRVPIQMLLSSDYLGEMKIGGSFGSFKVGEDLTKYFAQDQKGEKFLAQLYNTLENKEESYDCIAKRVCQVTGWEDPNSQNIVLEMPKMALLVSKDRKVMFRMMLMNIEPKGKLHNDLDLARGEINVPASEESPATRISLGQTWEEILAINGENAKTSASRTMMGKQYDGVFLGMTKSDFSRAYKKEPLPNEKLMVISVFGNYTNHLRLDGKLIELQAASSNSNNSGLNLALVDGDPVEGKSYLKLKLGLEPSVQVGFMRQLLALFKAELGKLGGETLTQMSGLYKAHGMKTYSGHALVYNEKTGKGRLISTALSEESRNLNFIEVFDITSNVDKVIIPAVLKPTDAGGTSLAGFTLGDRVTLTETDIGRSEATVVLPNSAGIERAGYTDTDFLRVSYDGERIVSEPQRGIGLGTLNVRLGLVPAKAGEKPAAANEFTVTSISNANTTVSKICGIDGLDAVPGTEDRAFLELLSSKISKAKAKNKSVRCRYAFQNDSGDTGRLSEIYFADQKLKISFNERELSLITVYVDPSEVK